MAKKIITKKQRLILMLLYTFRFVNSKQIQEFLNHKDHRRINSWLKDLTSKGYVERDFKKVYGILTKPAVYFLTALGRKDIKEGHNYYFPHYLRRISRDNKSSKAFRIKCQIIADWYLMTFPNNESTLKNNSKVGIDIIDNLELVLENSSKDYKDQIPLNKLQFFTPAHFPDFVLLGVIKPDAYLRKKTTKGITHGLLFVLDAYIPRFLLRYSLKKIFDSLNEESWEDESIQSLHLYYLCPNNKIIIYMRRLLRSYMENYYGKELMFNFTTRNQLYKKKQGKIDAIPWISISSTDSFDA